MCQAYEAERAGIIAEEDYATIKGFASAKFGKPKDANPYHPMTIYSRKAWDHGWGCWNEKILPWALEKEYHSRGEISGAQKVRNLFKQTGELPSDLEKIVERYSHY